MKSKIVYICSECKFEQPKWTGRCPNCGVWNSFLESEILKKTNSKSNSNNRVTSTSKKAQKLSDIKVLNSDRIITDLHEFNRVVGGGIVRDSISILAARPGAGKSTLLLQVAHDISKKGFKVLYASGEESESQIKKRADRIIGECLEENIWIYSDISLNNVLEVVKEVDPDFIIIDSIQTFVLEEYSSRPGSPIQTMECANELLRIAKNINRPRAVIIVGQMTKEDELAGVRALEHLVDCVLMIEGDSLEELRSLVCSKNRFGSTGEVGFFSMTEKGMISIDNPSQFFMTKRDEKDEVFGSSLSVMKEGNRCIIVEIESLVSNSMAPYPSRISDCLKKDQLNTLISILEERGKIKLFDKNVVIKATGGIRLREQCVNLAVIISIVSSLKNKSIDNGYVFIGDVGLTGEIKRVPSMELRLKEVDRIGFSKVYVPEGENYKNFKFKNIEVKPFRYIYEVINDVFKSK
ncbi:DNA repair protein RadA [Candidatus Arthromitus sp. SFB-turkey]|uniref:DNA repair protein RadA n=1 Tax=Candidatus Arthromitus sp. SFB-turkey TaxID=1840217 RepID=UPI0007F390AB|nr:DNA repair protein RadA [Candidatus Arthromitus sp. SFB-turkey]OAT89146.1 DNA repair protein RadA [Candidatus Arthromitus sp. SFB-turkey]